MNNRRPLITRALVLLVALAWLWLRPVPEAPHTAPPPGVFQRNGDTITPLQPFELEALVLSRRDYRSDRGARVSPTDLALGWGPMADPQVLARIDISQGERWYRWRTDDFPIARRAIETHSANMHLIPADKNVARVLQRIKPGQRIALAGQLVRVDGPDGFHWLSSLTRDDVGQGACELIWVQRLSTLD